MRSCVEELPLPRIAPRSELFQGFKIHTGEGRGWGTYFSLVYVDVFSETYGLEVRGGASREGNPLRLGECMPTWCENKDARSNFSYLRARGEHSLSSLYTSNKEVKESEIFSFSFFVFSHSVSLVRICFIEFFSYTFLPTLFYPGSTLRPWIAGPVGKRFSWKAGVSLQIIFYFIFFSFSRCSFLPEESPRDAYPTVCNSRVRAVRLGIYIACFIFVRGLRNCGCYKLGIADFAIRVCSNVQR